MKIDLSMHLAKDEVKKEKRKNEALDKLYKKAAKAERYKANRNARGTKQAVVLQKKYKAEGAPQVIRQTIGHTFLQYYRVVFRWALKTHNLRKQDLDLLLYLYPVGAFKKSEFDFMHNTMGIYSKNTLRILIEGGWISKVRVRRKNLAALYQTTRKTRDLCRDIHLMLLGEKDIPTTKSGNKLLTSDKVVDRFFMNVIKKMNSKK